MFTLKHNPDRLIQRYKARLIAKGLHKLMCKSFSPITKLNFARVAVLSRKFFSAIISDGHKKNAFLNGDLKEVKMDPPQDFVVKG